MAEHIDNNSTLLSSGSHNWLWGTPGVVDKTITAAGTIGAVGMRTHIGGVPVAITGILKGDSLEFLQALENEILDLVDEGRAMVWEDNAGRDGVALRLDRYVRLGVWIKDVKTGDIWQRYTLIGTEMSGRIL